MQVGGTAPQQSQHPPRGDDADLLRAQLRRLREKRIFFAHQSVGEDLLDGLRQLGARHPELAPTFAESSTPGALRPGRWAHVRVGANGDPLGKLRHLRALVDGGIGATADVVLFKLCYADVGAGTPVESLVRELAVAFRTLRTRHPATTFVAMTVPLTAAQRGPKAALKRLLGRPPGGAAENARRQALNGRIRTSLAAVFDLAHFESLDPAGQRAEVALGHQRVPVLARENTSDGGHLVPEARVRIARRLVEFVAGLG
jgi:hypothetical protein